MGQAAKNRSSLPGKEALTCGLCWSVTFTVFLGIVIIEALILPIGRWILPSSL